MGGQIKRKLLEKKKVQKTSFRGTAKKKDTKYPNKYLGPRECKT